MGDNTPMAKTRPARRRVNIFLSAYAECGSITAASAAAGVTKDAHFKRFKRDAEYRKTFEEIQDRVGQFLEDIAVDRAAHGTKRLQLWRGKPIKTKNGHLLYEVDYDNQLLVTLLKRFRPKLYREHVVQEHTGAVDLVQRLEAARARLVAMRKKEDDKDKTGS
jgi:hypothetical protein